LFIERMETLLQNTAVEAAYITSPENLRYYSGFTGEEAVLIIQKGTYMLFTDSRYVLQATREATDCKVVDIVETTAVTYLAKQAPGVIGFEEEHINAKKYRALCSALPNSSWQGVDGTIIQQRSIKNEKELELTRKAATLADAAFAHVLPLIKPGISERDIALELDWHMRKNGADGPSFPIICASGLRSAMPHGVATDKKLAPGDLITLDFGCFYQGYASDMTRTVVLGKATDEQKKIYNTVLKAQEAALNMIGPNVACKDADAAARGVITNQGYGSNFGHSLGHGTGLVIHEQPVLSPRSDMVLAPGMTVTVEPGIYVESLGGVRIEDLIIITKNGYENLTHSPKGLLEL